MRLMGGCEETETFLRLFLIPGVHHGRGGPGLTESDALTALEKWVERGTQPRASLSAADLSSLTPMLARYSGKTRSEERREFRAFCGSRSMRLHCERIVANPECMVRRLTASEN